MKEFAKKITELVAASKVDRALMQMYNLLSIAASDMKNEAVILRGRSSKWQADKRKGILAVSDETLEFNRISNAALELLDAMLAEEAVFSPFIDDLYDTLIRETKGVSALDESVSRKKMVVTETQKNTMFRRMASVKDLDLTIRGLWFDDTPDCLLSEFRLVQALGIQLDRVATDEESAALLAAQPYDFIISDILRGSNRKSGIDYLQEQVAKGIRIPTIFYITNFDEKRGTPPFAFGITNRPNELLHLVMDIIERQ